LRPQVKGVNARPRDGRHLRPKGISLMAQAPAAAPQPNNSPNGAGGGGTGARGAHGGFWTLAYRLDRRRLRRYRHQPALRLQGIVRARPAGRRGLATREEVLGIISLIFWALMIVVFLKYVIIVMQMDNKGEGGTLSLMALAQRALGKRTPLLCFDRRCGASMFYGDALITPAISVMSAVEGLKAVPGLRARSIRSSCRLPSAFSLGCSRSNRAAQA
jgi:KUP system potassium uptake protein